MKAVVFNTSGTGYWSRAQKAVEVIDMRVAYINEDFDFGELRVYFNKNTWNVDEDGLIYTDGQFYTDLQKFIKEQGLAVDLCYSEQGMQGDNYVSLDVGKEFLDSWSNKFNVKLETLL